MTTYYGIVKENKVILPEGVNLEEGTHVEIRVVSSNNAQATEHEAMERFWQLILASGIIRERRIPDASKPVEERELIPVQGKPLSEIVIEERR